MTDTNKPIVSERRTSTWKEGEAKTVTFVVTDECQLQCKYCYFVNKNNKNKLPFEIAKKTIDYLLNNRDIFNDKAIVIDFIGGEPFLEIELIDKICDYFKVTAYTLDHPWFENYRFSFSTNGLLYSDTSVQKYFKKNRHHLNVMITLDGTKEKHDLQRVFPNGKGSYDQVIQQIPLWLEQFPGANTKVTVGHEDLKYIKESVLHLWDLGMKQIPINVVFEDVWKENDDLLFEEQLTLLADEIIERELFPEYQCTFFDRMIGKPVLNNMNWCGAGKMLAIDYTGNFYPCSRFVSSSLLHKEALAIGNCDTGIDNNKLRPFLSLDLVSQSPKECIECDVATGCAWCQGANYDFADTDTIYQRATYICKMHKARVRANNYFWENIEYLKKSKEAS